MLRVRRLCLIVPGIAGFLLLATAGCTETAPAPETATTKAGPEAIGAAPKATPKRVKMGDKPLIPQ
jgi:hypothetical protein